MKDGRRIIFTADAKFAVAKADASTPEKVATLTGYALLWNVLSTDRGGFKVRLMPGSARFAAPTLALWHHDASQPIGSTANGTLRLFPDDVGVRVEIDLPDTTTGRDAERLVTGRYVQGMSFAMVATPTFHETTENGYTVLNATDYLVDEVTVTAIPSFPQTSVNVEPGNGYAARTAQGLRLQRLRFDILTLPGADAPRSAV